MKPNNAKFYDAVSLLIQYNIENRKYYEPYGKHSEYAKNHCTVRCSAGIKTGKSDYISFYSGSNDCVIVSKEIEFFGKATLIPATKLSHYYNVTFDKIWVDEPSLIMCYNTISEENIFLLAHNSQQTFIFLGD